MPPPKVAPPKPPAEPFAREGELMHIPTPPEIKKNKEGEEISSNTVPHPQLFNFPARLPLPPAKMPAGYRPESPLPAPPLGLLAAREHFALSASSMPLP